MAARETSTMRILIAEDDQVLADGLLRSLRSSGAAVDHVPNGIDADTALMTHAAFDLLILDLGLPCLLYTSPSPRDVEESRMPSSA